VLYTGRGTPPCNKCGNSRYFNRSRYSTCIVHRGSCTCCCGMSRPGVVSLP
jgi:hypothetical protein